MSKMSTEKRVNKYKVLESFAIMRELFLEGDVVFIQSSDWGDDVRQRVFDKDRKYLGWINSSMYWELVQKLYIKEVK